ncbi:MAG: phosphoglucosamine mutase [Candidatus Margulisbacteria bacterium]|jgi:phosphomannomutase|nr:phosphoglucosamine mutase [Candidatus Margulisiibacteriota bacterium]
MTLKISISGVRGYVPESLTPEVCLDLAKAFGTYLRGGKVVIGTDPRASSEFIKGIVFSGLLATGCEVIDLGICPTPTVGIMTRQLEAAGGIVITASHNPLPWNGLKFMRGDGIFLNEAQAKTFLQTYESKAFRLRPANKGVKADRSGLKTHIARVLQIVKTAAIRKKKFRVAVDACNGAGSVALVKLLEKLGCKIYAINTRLDLPFPHNPEPTPENISALRELVKLKKADIGFAMDSDADRLAVVAENGEALGEEATLALVVKFLLERQPALARRQNIVTVNLSTSRMIDDICRDNGALAVRTKVGEVHVAETLKKLNGLVGGEGNGGVIYPPVGFNRDSLTAAALLLNYLAVSGQKLTELAAALPPYVMVKSKLECRSLDEANDLVEKTKEIFRGEDLILTEGVKVVFPDAWLHVRASNTEPIIRLMAEARDQTRAAALIDRVTA